MRGDVYSNTIYEDSYREYIHDMMESKVKEGATYKGLKLSAIYKAEHVNLAIVEHPNFNEQKGLFFQVMQELWDNIKPLIEKARKGKQLTAAERKELDNNIADMSYIFASVMPFQRGSASANLALVYGLYQMAGIDVPQVKIGRALDLSAFASTPEDYKANWLNLFDGDFVNNQLNLKTDIAKAVPTANYPNLMKLEDAEGNTVAYYKHTKKGENHRTELFDIIVEEQDLQNKYPLVSLEYPKILSTHLSDLPNNIAQYIKAHIPHDYEYRDLIMTAVNTSGYISSKFKADAFKTLNGKPITIEEWNQVINLFTDLNNVGFYHTDLLHNLFFRRDESGKLILTIIDFNNWGKKDDIKDLELIGRNLESIGAKEVADLDLDDESDFVFPVQFPSCLKDLILPVGISLALGFAFGGFNAPGLVLASSAGLALSSTFPIGSIYSRNKGNTKNNNIDLKTEVKKVQNVEPKKGDAVDAYAVWELIDRFDKTIAYFKLTLYEEIERTILLDRIMIENDLQNRYSLIGIEYPKFLSNKFLDLPEDIVSQIKTDMDGIIDYIRGGKERAQIPLITSAVNTEGFVLSNKIKTDVYGDIINDLTEVSEEALSALQGKPITEEEWAQIINFFKELNRSGFYHGDLKHNLFLRRDGSGKLIISMVDFEDASNVFGTDLAYLETLGERLEILGAKETPAPAEKPLNLTDIVEAIPVTALVMQLKDSQNNIVAYYKRTEEDEIDRTELFDEIITENNLQNRYPLIELEYPRILSKDLSYLPAEISRQIKLLFDGHKFLTEDMILTPVNTEGAYEHNPNSNKSARQTLQETLQGKQITNEEWAQVVNLVKDFNEAGFTHSDLENNIFFSRDNGKLIITIIDFESYGEGYGDYDDISALETVRLKLESIGAKEKSVPENLAGQESTNQSSFNLPSWVLPAVGVGLLAFSLLNPATAPLALAALPLVGGIKMTAAQPKTKSSSEVEKLVNLRKQFAPDIFSGKPLNKEESRKMKEILGEDFFNLWQKYYNKDLAQFAKDNPQDLKEIIKYSDIFETQLPSVINNKYEGTNPLFIFTMRDIMGNAIKNLQSGQTMQSVIENLGQDINDYHYKIAQIKLFQEYKQYLSIGSKIPWDDFNSVYSLDATELSFGISRNEGGIFRVNPINQNVYGEYLTDMLNSLSGREKTYEDVKLSTVEKHTKEGLALVNHPVFDEKQKEAFYQVLQKIWKGTTKPLINQRLEGKSWNAYLRQRLDKSIASIIYLFCNVMPFERGSASAATILTYAFYKMAGLEAAPVKTGRSLDLSAFAMDYDDYVENWRDLFDGNFVNLQTDINIQPNAIPAKMLFTEEYKNQPLFLDDPMNMYNNLPPEFEEEGVMFRGRIFDKANYDKFKQMFLYGLKGKDTTNGDGRIYATDIVKNAIYPYSLRTQYGDIPVLVKIKISKNNRPLPMGMHEFTFKDITPEDIKEVLVWDKVTWRRAIVNDNGEIILQPTENIQTVNTFVEKEANSKTGNNVGGGVL